MARRTNTKDKVVRLKPRRDPRINVALARGLEILRSFRQDEIHLPNHELARRAGIPKATVSRLTHTLHALGYLNYSEESGQYSIAPGILALGYSVLANNEIHAVARPLLERLAAETQSVVGLGIRDGVYMIYLESAKGQTAVRRDSSVGYRVPICGSAMGWACLASLRPGEREAVLEQVRRQTPAAEWNALNRKVQRAMADVWKKGFCISYGDIDPVVNAVGVPFLHRSAMGAYALNCVSPAYLFTAQTMETEIGPRLMRLAEELHGSLSFGASPSTAVRSSR